MDLVVVTMKQWRRVPRNRAWEIREAEAVEAEIQRDLIMYVPVRWSIDSQLDCIWFN